MGTPDVKLFTTRCKENESVLTMHIAPALRSRESLKLAGT